MEKHCSTISFGLKHRKDKKGKSPITMLISSNGERVEFQTGKKIELENWDNKKQQVKGKSEEAQLINAYLNQLRNKVYLKEIELMQRGFLITALRWNQILSVDEFTVIEKKTSKQRTLRLNPQLQKHIQECYEHIKPIGVKAPILVSQKGTIYTIQAINRILKDIKKKYRLKIKNFSCHSLRKTFGRQVYNMNSENSELALIKLMELFNHSSLAITKRYLGLRQEEILQTYDCLTF